MTEEKMSPLRQQMIEDLRIRGMDDKSQKSYIRAINDFASFHGIRKAFAVEIAEQGGSFYEVLSVLSHSDEKTAAIYTKKDERV